MAGPLAEREQFGGSGCGGGIEPVDELGELFDHGSVVVVWVLADEVDHHTIAVGRLSAIAARLVHHSEPVPTVVHVGEPEEQVACSRLGLIELGGTDEVHHGIGGGIKGVLVEVFLLGPGEAGGNRCLQLCDGQAIRSGALVALRRVVLRLGCDQAVALGRLVLGETALLIFVAAAAVAGIIASGL